MNRQDNMAGSKHKQQEGSTKEAPPWNGQGWGGVKRQKVRFMYDQIIQAPHANFASIRTV